MLALGYPQLTVIHNLVKENHTFNVFFGDFPSMFFLRDLRFPPYIENFKFMEEFESHVNAGNLADYTFLEPQYFTVDPFAPANDQHPSHDVIEGEKLIARMYEILRNGPQWNETALLITYDEHGGFFDHFPTPFNGIPNPDGRVSTNPPFNFTQLGVRVPAILVSPWVNAGTILRGNNRGPSSTSEFSHSSVPATIKSLFNLEAPFLTERDAWAATFDFAFLDRDSPRTDCPTKIPTPPSHKPADLKAVEHTQPINDFQRTLIEVANGLDADQDDQDEISKLVTEKDGALFARKKLEAHLKKYVN
jgi:phospholipase C